MKKLLFVIGLIIIGFFITTFYSKLGLPSYPLCLSLPPYKTAHFDWSAYKYSEFRNSCLIFMGSIMKDPSVCNDYRGEGFTDCYQRLGKASKDPSICEKSVNMNDKRACYIGIVPYNTSQDWCASLSDFVRDGCYWSYAVGKNDEQQCLNISRTEIGNGQLYNCVVDMAINKDNIAVCALLDNSMPSNINEETCRTMIANPNRQKEVRRIQ